MGGGEILVQKVTGLLDTRSAGDSHTKGSEDFLTKG